jgi:hypothetical protein
LYKLARDIRSKAADPNACLAHVKQTFVVNSPTDDQIKLAVEQLTLSPDEALYVVGRLANRMQTDTKEVALGESNLEHIYPRNPAQNEWGGAAGQEVLEPYLWHIGNLMMLGRRLNRDAGNKEFGVKKPSYADKSELEMAKAVATWNAWDKAAIEARAKQLAPLVINVWNFDNPSRV